MKLPIEPTGIEITKYLFEQQTDIKLPIEPTGIEIKLHFHF